MVQVSIAKSEFVNIETKLICAKKILLLELPRAARLGSLNIMLCFIIFLEEKGE